MNDKVQMADVCDASVTRGASYKESQSISGYYVVECYGADSQLKWKDDIYNVVTTVGLNLTMDTILGNAAAGAVVMGLKGTGTAIAANTQASHASWLEVGLANAPTYTGNRPTPTFSAAAAGAKTTASAVSFSMTSSGTVAGCFINIGGSSTKDNTTGTLFSAGDFTGGSRTVINGDTLAVTYIATAS